MRDVAILIGRAFRKSLLELGVGDTHEEGEDGQSERDQERSSWGDVGERFGKVGRSE